MNHAVLVVAAHPDDEVLGMGGTIARHVDGGDRVTVIWVTDGSSHQYREHPEILKRKYAEGVAALELLGVHDCIKAGLPDMRLDMVEHVAVNAVIEEAIAATRADIVYAPLPDLNRDHRAVFESTAVAARPIPGASVRRFLAYPVPSSAEGASPGTIGLNQGWFTDITSTLERKIKAFAEHRTETRDWPHPRSTRSIRAQAEAYGSTIGVAAAEVFALIRALEG